MLSPQMIFLSAIVIYVLGLVYIGIRASNKQSSDEFVIGSRNVGLIPTMGSLAASFRDGMGAVFWTGLAYSFGYGPIWLIFGAMLALVFLAIVGPKVREHAEKEGFVTIGDFIKNKLGPKTEKIVSLFVVIKSVLFISIQLYVIGIIASNVFGVEGSVGIVGTAVVILMYLYFGGYSSVVKTDALQFFMIMGLLAVPFFIQPEMSDVTNIATITSMGWQESLGLFLLGIFYIIAGAETWQRLFSARDKKVIRLAFPLAGVFLLVMTLNLIAIGYGMISILPEGTQAEDALFALFSHMDVASPYVLSFMGVTIMAISMSTLDTEAYVFTSSLTRNFLPERYTKTKEDYIRISRKLIVAVLVGTSLIAMTISDVIKFLFDAVSLVFVIAPLMVYMVMGWVNHTKKQDTFLAVSIFASAGVYLYMFLNELFINTLYNMVPLGVSVVLCGLSLLLTRKSA